VTARLRAGLPSLRRDAPRRVLERAFARGAQHLGLRVIHYSIQTNHLHLIVEADDRRALSRGMQGLLVRVARALNKLLRRSGSVFGDRYHARALLTPREVRTALVYVLQNVRNHGIHVLGIDACTSGAWFDGWSQPIAGPARASPCAQARTWSLRIGWRRHGLLRIDEAPRSAHIRQKRRTR
jgi:REP element-mobilizing transposase RayT